MKEVMMQIVVDENGQIVYDSDGRVCLQNNEQNSGTEDDSSSNNEAEDQNLDIKQTFTEDARAHWTRNNILRLISAYKEHYELFRSNSVKNSEAWRRVAEDVPGFSTKQCEAKFKYLKSLYKKQRNYNMGNNGGGARAVTFDYYEEMDDIFNEDPIITPVYIASSSRIAESPPSQLRSKRESAIDSAGHSKRKKTRLEIQLDKFSSIAETPPSQLRSKRESAIASAGLTKRKRTRLEIQLDKFQRNMELREQARERRMNRFLEQQEICTNRICDMMQKFIDKL